MGPYSRIKFGTAVAIMDIEFTEEEQAFREEVRRFVRKRLTAIGIMFGDSDTHVQRNAALLRGAAGTPSVAPPV